MININILVTSEDDDQLVNETYHDFDSAKAKLEALDYEYSAQLASRDCDE